MLSIFDTDSAVAVLSQPLDPELRTLIEGRLADAAAIGLADLTQILVIQRGDTEAMIQEEIGWSPLVHPIDEVRHDQPTFTPYWSWLEDLGANWFELVHTVGTGYAYIFIIAKAEGVMPELLQLCRSEATT